MTTHFWINEPTILFDKKYMLELWPTSEMTYNQKLISITRLIIILSVFGFTFTKNINMLVSGSITILVVFLFYKINTRKLDRNLLTKEGFQDGFPMKKDGIVNGKEPLGDLLKTDYAPTNYKNPLSNVLLPEIKYNPERKSAPPSFNTEVYGDINDAAKKTIQSMNPGIKTTDKQLFGDLGENFEFDQSMRSFYSTPSTQIPNDQGAYANYLYGDMPSCRDGDGMACVKDNYRYTMH